MPRVAPAPTASASSGASSGCSTSTTTAAVVPFKSSGSKQRRSAADRPLPVAIGEPRAISEFALDQQVGMAPVALPASVTGAAITAVLSYDPERFPHRLRNTIAPLLFCGAMTVLLEICMVYGVASMVLDQRSEAQEACHKKRLTLHVSCNMVFVAMIVISLKESLEMHRWLHRIPRVRHHAALKFQKMQQGSHQFYSPAEGIGITRTARCAMYAFVLLPKVLVTLMILVFGSAFLHHAEGEGDLLMDCVGMIFIAEIDGLVYRFALSGSQMTLLMSIPPLGLSLEAFRANHFERFVEKNGPWLAVGTLMVLVPALELWWCGTVLQMP